MTFEPMDPNPISIHVLVVEDDPDLRALLRTFLQDEGCSVCAASDGQMALDLLRQTSERWVVLADHQMPRLNGAGLIAAVLADPQLAARHAFIYMTAADRVIPPDLQLQLETLGAPILGKPFTFDACLAAVAAASMRLADAHQPS
jgi:CheY-like chemotaxis protein